MSAIGGLLGRLCWSRSCAHFPGMVLASGAGLGRKIIIVIAFFTTYNDFYGTRFATLV